MGLIGGAPLVEMILMIGTNLTSIVGCPAVATSVWFYLKMRQAVNNKENYKSSLIMRLNLPRKTKHIPVFHFSV